MNKKHLKGWLKHGDFILLDLLCLQLSFCLAFWLLHGLQNPYQLRLNQYHALLLFISQLLVVLFGNGYSGVVRRKRFDEAVAVLKYMLLILLVALVFLFVTHRSATVSRLHFGLTSVLFVILAYVIRQGNKRRIYRANSIDKNNRSIVLITSSALVKEVLDNIQRTEAYHDVLISGVVLLDSDAGVMDLSDVRVPIVALEDETAMQKISHGWVDEVFLLQPEDQIFPAKLMDDLMTMGITVNYTISALNNDRWPVVDVRKIGPYKVLTNSLRFATTGELAVKRLLDILGGLVGCLATGIIFLFVAPMIYRADPGPIFFTQERVGQNGKTFKMHKFRSMYMDAEERKAALMDQNNIKDGFMFKMDDDPRIIGSEKKDKNDNPRGIGNILRDTSLDEFPQFFDVLTGKLSLVGWRPCTLNEWKLYDLQHRIRASMKPGITGMWQVSGRSSITDFNEVVRLDREYIENWSLLLDIKILLKTVAVVLKRQGAK